MLCGHYDICMTLYLCGLFLCYTSFLPEIKPMMIILRQLRYTCTFTARRGQIRKVLSCWFSCSLISLSDGPSCTIILMLLFALCMRTKQRLEGSDAWFNTTLTLSSTYFHSTYKMPSCIYLSARQAIAWCPPSMRDYWVSLSWTDNLRSQYFINYTTQQSTSTCIITHKSPSHVSPRVSSVNISPLCFCVHASFSK